MQVINPIEMDEKAVAQALIFQRDNSEWQNLPVRVYIDGKGCDGFDYGVSFDAAKEDDTHFQQTDSQGNKIDLVVDPESLKFVQGSKIIWVDDERGRGFLVENPNHRKFRGKFYKRAEWEKKLLGTS